MYCMSRKQAWRNAVQRLIITSTLKWRKMQKRSVRRQSMVIAKWDARRDLECSDLRENEWGPCDIGGFHSGSRVFLQNHAVAASDDLVAETPEPFPHRALLPPCERGEYHARERQPAVDSANFRPALIPQRLRLRFSATFRRTGGAYEARSGCWMAWEDGGAWPRAPRRV